MITSNRRATESQFLQHFLQTDSLAVPDPRAQCFLQTFFSFSSEEGGNVLSELHSVRGKRTHGSLGEIFCVGGASRDFENTGQALSSHFLKHDYFSYLGEFCKAFFRLSVIGGKSKSFLLKCSCYSCFIIALANQFPLKVEMNTLELIVAYINRKCVSFPSCFKTVAVQTFLSDSSSMLSKNLNLIAHS